MTALTPNFILPERVYRTLFEDGAGLNLRAINREGRPLSNGCRAEPASHGAMVVTVPVVWPGYVARVEAYRTDTREVVHSVEGDALFVPGCGCLSEVHVDIDDTLVFSVGLEPAQP